MESLNKEQDKLVQIGTIKSTKDQSLAAGVSNQSKGNDKSKDSKQQRVKEKKHSDAKSSSSYEDSKSKRMNNKKEKPKCGYCRGYHYEKYYFRKNLDIMTNFL